MKEDRVEEISHDDNLKAQEVRQEFPSVKTGIKAGPEIDNDPPMP